MLPQGKTLAGHPMLPLWYQKQPGTVGALGTYVRPNQRQQALSTYARKVIM